MTDQHPAHNMPTKEQLDAFTDAFTKVVALAMSAGLLDRPEDFYLVAARTGQSWNLGTGRASDWFTDTLAQP